MKLPSSNVISSAQCAVQLVDMIHNFGPSTSWFGICPVFLYDSAGVTMMIIRYLDTYLVPCGITYTCGPFIYKTSKTSTPSFSRINYAIWDLYYSLMKSMTGLNKTHKNATKVKPDRSLPSFSPFICIYATWQVYILILQVY